VFKFPQVQIHPKHPQVNIPGTVRRLLLVTPKNSYRTAAYLRAAARLNLLPLVVSDAEPGALSAGAAGVRVSLRDEAADLALLVRSSLLDGVHGVVGAEERALPLAAAAAKYCGLPHNSVDAVRVSRDKYRARLRHRRAGLNTPDFALARPRDAGAVEAMRKQVGFPCVVKPLALSASQGVIRSDDAGALARNLRRVRRILRDQGFAGEELLVEKFIPGTEVAVEAVLHRGELIGVAIFDKPDEMDGPFFEESCYTTPSRLPQSVQREVYRVVGQTCRAQGLFHGPVHVECRINDDGVWPLEAAARTIGGECARLFTLAGGEDLESMVLRNALGEPPAPLPVAGGAGVLMLPAPGPGTLRRVGGLSAARAVPGVVEIKINVREGQVLRPWPEGAVYPGFVFAAADSPAAAEAALRRAGELVHFVLAPLLPVTVV